jgi:hypothetical protein
MGRLSDIRYRFARLTTSPSSERAVLHRIHKLVAKEEKAMGLEISKNVMLN